MILITGCTGYIGSRLCRHLLMNGYKVSGLIRPSERERADCLIDLGLIPYYGDLADPSSLHEMPDDIDFVYHLAGIHSTYRNTYNLYVQGTINLLGFLSHNPRAAMVLASNSAVYTDTFKANLEDTTLLTNNPFGKITIEMEKAVMKSCKNYAIFRIGEVYGDSEANPFNVCSKGITLLGDGMNYTSKLHIKDLIHILTNCIHNFPQGIFNICDDLPIRQIEYYQYVEELSKTKCIHLKPVMEFNERIMLSIHGLRMLNIAMDNRLIKNNLKYEFFFPTYRDGLKYLYENQC
ncbi:NAD-dependent epimerase/dehydratase family protein [Vallitalea sediminicola]